MDTDRKLINLRPESLDTFIGQAPIKSRLAITLFAAKSRNDPLPHQLFAGPPGLGKTTLAQILAHETGVKIKITSGPTLEKPGDIVGTLLSLEPNQILFIDEIHRMPPILEEYLYPALEDQQVDIFTEGSTSGQPNAIRMKLNPFTLIGATTKPGNLSAPLRSRFQTIHKLELYGTEDLTKIILQSAEKILLDISTSAAEEIAKRSRGTPRIANNNLLWVRDYATAKNTTIVKPELAKEALSSIELDEHGLDKADRKILEKLVKDFKGGPVGIAALAAACGEDTSTLEEMHEPYLVAEGYMKRSSTGRIALDKANKLFGVVKSSQNSLL